MHLVKSLLTVEEINQLRSGFDAVGTAAGTTHSRVLIEDGNVVCPELQSLISSPLEQRILPYVRARMGDSRVVVADALIRAYRQKDRRQALSPHFDVSSFATVIIPLNPGEYEGGLFIQPGADASTRLAVDSDFEIGDALVHRFDVMHGVDVTAGDRYSLVLWLADCKGSVEASAAPWMAGAADAGNAYAQFLYSEMLKEGSHGAQQDLAMAVEYGMQAAQQGHALSQFNLGFMYAQGRGVKKSAARCAELWRSAAEGGLASAQMNLANSLAYGYLGLEIDTTQARQWYERAARQGHAEAAALLDWFQD